MDDTFSTKDIELAAFLRASDLKITDVRRNDAGKTVFVFSDIGGATKKLALAFYNREDQISASRLLWNFGQIKSLVFDLNAERDRGART